LVKFFVERKEKEYFAATLYTCYEYLKPDLVLEYAWRFNMYEFAMPFMIQLISEMKNRENEVNI
jgi:clathrin heavy chain